MAKRYQYRRAHCTEQCPRRQNPETTCSLCESLDKADQFWELLSPIKVWKTLWQAHSLKIVRLWHADAQKYLKGPTGYRVVVPAIITFIGAYFGLYAIMEARHERRLNRAAFERSAFTDLVTSNHRGAFVSAIKRFGPTQTMQVPPEPRILAPWEWWAQPNQPNMLPLWSWAQHFFPLCRPQFCSNSAPETGYKSFVDSARHLNKAYRVDLSLADLKGADRKP